MPRVAPPRGPAAPGRGESIPAPGPAAPSRCPGRGAGRAGVTGPLREDRLRPAQHVVVIAALVGGLHLREGRQLSQPDRSPTGIARQRLWHPPPPCPPKGAAPLRAG